MMMTNAAKSFDILATSLSDLYNYFKNSKIIFKSVYVYVYVCARARVCVCLQLNF